jgi:hypothetical protein
MTSSHTCAVLQNASERFTTKKLGKERFISKLWSLFRLGQLIATGITSESVVQAYMVKSTVKERPWWYRLDRSCSMRYVAKEQRKIRIETGKPSDPSKVRCCAAALTAGSARDGIAGLCKRSAVTATHIGPDSLPHGGEVIATGDADCIYPFYPLPELLSRFDDNQLEFLSTNRLHRLQARATVVQTSNTPAEATFKVVSSLPQKAEDERLHPGALSAAPAHLMRRFLIHETSL